MSDLRAMARALAETQRGELHPSPDDLESYQAGSLSPERADRVLRHLAVCAECTQTVLDLETFPEIEPADPHGALTAGDVAARWTRFERRWEQESPRQRQASDLAARIIAWLTASWRSLSFARAAVAFLLMVVAGLSWTLLSERRQPDDAGAPLLNLALVELAPLAVSGQRGEVRAVQLSADAGGVLLALALLDQRTFPAYGVEIVSEATGGTVWESRKLKRTPEGIFTVQIARDFLPGGTYRVDLRGIDGDLQEPLASYRLELVIE